MLEWRYLLLIELGVVFAPLLGTRIELIGLVSAPSKPNDSLQLCLSLLWHLDFRHISGSRFEYFLQLLLADEVADSPGKIPHGLQVYLELIIWEPKLLVYVECLLTPVFIHPFKVSLKISKRLPLCQCTLVLFQGDSKYKVLQVLELGKHFCLLVSFLSGYLLVDSQFKLELIHEL